MHIFLRPNNLTVDAYACYNDSIIYILISNNGDGEYTVPRKGFTFVTVQWRGGCCMASVCDILKYNLYKYYNFIL